jgi:hypothetical protein
MTSAGGDRKPGSESKSLKDQNRWQLWIIVAINSVLFAGVVQANSIRLDGLTAAFSDFQKLVPVGLAIVITTVLNGLLSTAMKERLVFLRWKNALPGHRAFSKYSLADPRIDPAILLKIVGGVLPVTPLEQNQVWYRVFYKTVDNDSSVRQVHRDFLLLRDYTGFCALFIMFCGGVGLYVIRSLTTALLYLAFLVLQYIVVRQAASNYGVRFVTTVLALKAAKHEAKPLARARSPRKKQPPKDAPA